MSLQRFPQPSGLLIGVAGCDLDGWSLAWYYDCVDSYSRVRKLLPRQTAQPTMQMSQAHSEQREQKGLGQQQPLH